EVRRGPKVVIDLLSRYDVCGVRVNYVRLGINILGDRDNCRDLWFWWNRRNSRGHRPNSVLYFSSDFHHFTVVRFGQRQKAVNGEIAGAGGGCFTAARVIENHRAY